jgi:hypothetical protein
MAGIDMIRLRMGSRRVMRMGKEGMGDDGSVLSRKWTMTNVTWEQFMISPDSSGIYRPTQRAGLPFIDIPLDIEKLIIQVLRQPDLLSRRQFASSGCGGAHSVDSGLIRRGRDLRSLNTWDTDG